MRPIAVLSAVFLALAPLVAIAGLVHLDGLAPEGFLLGVTAAGVAFWLIYVQLPTSAPADPEHDREVMGR